MANCTNEIIGIKSLNLHINSNVIFYRPAVLVEGSINLIVEQAAFLTVSDFNQNSTWQRSLNYSGNYSQVFEDTLSFTLHSVENGTPAILQSMRNSRVGYVVEMTLKDNTNYVFQSPFFLSDANIKQINSHSWNVVLKYRKPTFKDYLLNIVTITYSINFDSTFTKVDNTLITFDRL